MVDATEEDDNRRLGLEEDMQKQGSRRQTTCYLVTVRSTWSLRVPLGFSRSTKGEDTHRPTHESPTATRVWNYNVIHWEAFAQFDLLRAYGGTVHYLNRVLHWTQWRRRLSLRPR